MGKQKNKRKNSVNRPTEKATLSPDQRRLIERHQNPNTGRTPVFLSAFSQEDLDCIPEGERGEPQSVFREMSDTERQAVDRIDDDRPEPLWVFEANDFDDLDIDQVRTIWSRRLDLCGSVEAAAEALALSRVFDGVDESYRGWQSYLDDIEIRRFSNYLETKEAFCEGGSSCEAGFLSPGMIGKTPQIHEGRKEGLTDLTESELASVWGRRPYGFESIETAAEALSLLRYYSKVDEVKRSWVEFLDHPEIEKLREFLPELEVDQYPPSSGDVHTDADSISETEVRYRDERVTVERSRVEREGQGRFRRDVLDAFGSCCCLTGEHVETVLEAAHIYPYMGKSSNAVSNGLCLRSDIHRLFDRFLLSVNPDQWRVELSSEIRGSHGYGWLHGEHVTFGSFAPDRDALASHYKSFSKVEADRRAVKRSVVEKKP